MGDIGRPSFAGMDLIRRWRRRWKALHSAGVLLLWQQEMQWGPCYMLSLGAACSGGNARCGSGGSLCSCERWGRTCHGESMGWWAAAVRRGSGGESGLYLFDAFQQQG
jgi:hypothetical protein